MDFARQSVFDSIYHCDYTFSYLDSDKGIRAVTSLNCHYNVINCHFRRRELRYVCHIFQILVSVYQLAVFEANLGWLDNESILFLGIS